MKELKLILCDDDESMLDLIAKAISETFKRYGILSSIDTFTSVDAFYSAIKVYSYDIAFLDIDMPTLDGISLGIKMRSDGKNIPIVFVSSREDKMHDTFKIQPFAFIRKNCFLKDCDETVSRFALLFKKEAQKNFISLRMGNTVTNFNLADIIYIESYNGCQYLHLKTISEPYRMKRLFAFLDPWVSPQGEGFQLIQSLYSLGNGGMFGVGLFNSRQKYLFLPFAESDFIFSIIGEEFGYFGAILLILVFGALCYFLFKIGLSAKDRFGCLLALGVGVLIAVQTLLNIAVVTGSIPPTGLPLPFISSGGTSVAVFMAGVGVCVNVHRQSKIS